MKAAAARDKAAVFAVIMLFHTNFDLKNEKNEEKQDKFPICSCIF